MGVKCYHLLCVTFSGAVEVLEGFSYSTPLLRLGTSADSHTCHTLCPSVLADREEVGRPLPTFEEILVAQVKDASEANPAPSRCTAEMRKRYHFVTFGFYNMSH